MSIPLCRTVVSDPTRILRNLLKTSYSNHRCTRPLHTSIEKPYLGAVFSFCTFRPQYRFHFAPKKEKLSKFPDENLCRERSTGKLRVDGSYRDNRLRDSVSRRIDVVLFTGRSYRDNRPVRHNWAGESITPHVPLFLFDFEISASARAWITNNRSISRKDHCEHCARTKSSY